MPIREIEPQDIPVITIFETEISMISFGEDAITDPLFHTKKLEKALRYEREGMLVLDVDGEVSGWMWITPRKNSKRRMRISKVSILLNPAGEPPMSMSSSRRE